MDEKKRQPIGVESVRLRGSKTAMKTREPDPDHLRALMFEKRSYENHVDDSLRAARLAADPESERSESPG